MVLLLVQIENGDCIFEMANVSLVLIRIDTQHEGLNCSQHSRYLFIVV